MTGSGHSAGAQAASELDSIRARLRAATEAVHLVGIGGVGMAALARLLLEEGIRVSGSDLVCTDRTQALEAAGAHIVEGHGPDRIPADAAWVVHTSAVTNEHPELAEARRRGLPVCRRAPVLAAWLSLRRSIAVGGTHGKSSTTAMLATILQQADPAAGYVLGWEIPGWPHLARAGRGGWVVAEADESDGTLPFYRPDIAVITNVDFDHMEHFADESAFVGSFRAFANARRKWLVVNGDDPAASALAEDDDRAIRYGETPGADVSAASVRLDPDRSTFTVFEGPCRLGAVELPVPGRHNIDNALAAICAARLAGVGWADICTGLSAYRPPARRLETVWAGSDITVLSDYAHHPTELKAVLHTVSLRRPGRLIMIFQPHRFTRTRALGPEFPASFRGADRVVLVPVYPASEEPLAGGTSEDLLNHCRAQGMETVGLASSPQDAWQAVRADLRAGDLVVLCGAGDIDKLRASIPAELGGNPGQSASPEESAG